MEADSWTPAVRGLVDEELEITFDELQRRFILVEQHSVLTCISNEVGGPLVGSSAWTGVRLREVLAAARPRAGAVDVVFRCADGYSASIPLERASDPSVLLAIAQNGRPLAREHGFPCRVRAPALYGIKNAEWLEAIEIADYDQRSYWTRRGWTETGVGRTQSRIDAPERAERGRPTWIAGVAWAGLRGISRVEVSVDGGRSGARHRSGRPSPRTPGPGGRCAGRRSGPQTTGSSAARPTGTGACRTSGGGAPTPPARAAGTRWMWEVT